MYHLKYLLGSLLVMLTVFWVLNASEKIYTLVNKPPIQETILGSDAYNQLNNIPDSDDFVKIKGKVMRKDFFRNPSRWHQVRKWYARSISDTDTIEKLAFITLLAAAIFETFIALIFLVAILKWTKGKTFPYEWYQVGILASIILFTGLFFFDAVLDGNRLELFEHQVYIGMGVLFYLVSWLDNMLQIADA